MPRFLLLWLVIQHLSSCYVTQQAWQQGKLYRSRQPITEVLQSPSTDPQVRAQLAFSQQVIAYAASQGLNCENAYRYYVQLGGDSVSYLVQAAYPDRLEAVTWWFPIVGSVPYRGYFDKAERDRYAESLRKEGYDIYLGTATAFSSLGWFDDPLYSSMLRRGRASLAAVLFHELTHRTVWISGQADFNEQLASFVEVHLTRKYFAELKLEDELKRYETLLHDQRLFADWVDALSSELKDFYKKNAENTSVREQDLFLQQKNAIFERFVSQRVPRFIHYDFLGEEPWNNARVLASVSYLPDYQRFNTSLQCSKASSIGAYLQQIQAAWQKRGAINDPYTIVDQFCSAQGSGHNDHNRENRTQQ
jgi:predicted aminopeptidase